MLASELMWNEQFPYAELMWVSMEEQVTSILGKTCNETIAGDGKKTLLLMVQNVFF